MHGLIEKLRLFDRKERFVVLREVLGFHSEAPCLDRCFRGRLAKLIETDVPKSCFLAMDYHLDWIQLAIYLAKNPGIQPGCRFSNPDIENINMSQRDVDLLIAFQDPAEKTQTHLVMIEAKAYSSWDNDQLKKKIDRLGKIMNIEEVQETCELKPHFVLMTGAESENIQCASWDTWMLTQEKKLFWLKYTLSERYKVTRCGDNKVGNKEGDHLRLDSVRK